MKITIDLVKIEIDFKKIKSFYESIATCSGSLCLKKSSKEIEIFHISKEEEKTTKSLEKSLDYLGFKKDSNFTITITILKSFTIVEIIFDNFYSFKVQEEAVEDSLKGLLAKLNGYEQIECVGFTVKNKEGKKIQPKEFIYIKNTMALSIPKQITYSKQSFNGFVKSNVLCFSPILKSVLSSTSLNFVSGDSQFNLSLQKDVYNLSFSLQNEFILEKKKLEGLKSWFKANNSKLMKMLTKIYLNKEINCKLSKFKKSQLDYLYRFINVVPTFHDERDLITLKLMQIYDKQKSANTSKIKCDYLGIKSKKYIDRTPIGSIKEYLNKQNEV